jgi:hypothetical protein
MRYPSFGFRQLAATMTLFTAGCTEPRGAAVNAQTPSPCEAPRQLATLPDDIVEASGVVFSATNPAVIWVHNDSDRHLYALDRNGALQARVRLPEPEPRDWEDIATGPCPGGGSCLYLADIGDNLHVRSSVSVLRVPEPALDAGKTAEPERFTFRYPDGARDAEALFLLGGRIHIVSKGRAAPIALYRAPPRLGTEPMDLERVRALTPGGVQLPDQVTGAGATPDGRWVVLRTYSYLDLYRVAGDTLPASATTRVNLTPLREPQGEGVAINAAGEILLVSERALGRPGSLSYLQCRLE